MSMRRRLPRFLSVLIVVATTGLFAQQLPPSLKTGNPTPGSSQPDPPDLTMRITLTGCVQVVARSSGDTATQDPNTPSASRFVLTMAERMNVVPVGTGTVSAATESSSGTYRLNAIDSQLSPCVGARVEISGELVRLTAFAEASADKSAVEKPDATPGKPGNGAESTPMLQVEFVERIGPCS